MATYDKKSEKDSNHVNPNKGSMTHSPNGV